MLFLALKKVQIGQMHSFSDSNPIKKSPPENFPIPLSQGRISPKSFNTIWKIIYTHHNLQIWSLIKKKLQRRKNGAIRINCRRELEEPTGLLKESQPICMVSVSFHFRGGPRNFSTFFKGGAEKILYFSRELDDFLLKKNSFTYYKLFDNKYLLTLLN